ncbi:hypothetical protein BDV35DRAFT_389421 [Aspergillus flavus]|uniref:Uncharacterized protein n=1 Tax=Aspergillus flavus TaxID=5059 RepID=A0A5N6H736_ASPFL|nr:hypothetical protein BDV35DRAFT_389421 [Aspergillus flavus]
MSQELYQSLCLELIADCVIASGRRSPDYPLFGRPWHRLDQWAFPRSACIRRIWTGRGRGTGQGVVAVRTVGISAKSSGIGGPPQYNELLDMDLPNLELLESTRRANKFLYPGYGSRDLWVRIIEQSAPGYLGLEAKGGRWNSSWMIS